MDIEKLYQELETLPKGYLSKKVIKGLTYFYLQYPENGKLVSRYVPKDKVEELSALLRRRKEIEKILKQANQTRPLRKLSSRDRSLTGALMSGDRVTARFRDGKIVFIDPSLCPLYIKRTQDVSSFLASRTLDLSRPNARLLLKMLGIQDKKDEYIALYAHGACISDNYWFKPSGSRLTYANICFDNEAFSDLALKGQIRQMPAMGGSPELTAIGSFEKCWKKINGEWWMYKAGKREEIFSELFCYHLSKALNIPTAIYEYSEGFIRTKNFADTMNFEPMFSLAGDNETYDFVFNILYDLHPSIAQAYIQLLWFDCLVFNPDRHNQNYGLLRDRVRGKILSFAPNFDNNLALIALNKTLNQNPKSDAFIALFTKFLKTNNVALELYQTLPMPSLNEVMVKDCFKEIPIEEDEKAITDFILGRYRYLKTFHQG